MVKTVAQSALRSSNGVLVRRPSSERVKAMPGRSNQLPVIPHSLLPLGCVSLFMLMAIHSVVSPTWAEIRVVNAQGEHRMGDRDTREDAVRLASESAKRNALEQVATYLESVTVVNGMDITRDEIRTYTAGLVLVLNQRITTALDGETVVVKVDLLAQMDTEELAHAIAALRANEDARVQLAALKLENEQLQQELDAATQALENASTLEQTQQAAQRRQEVLNRVQSNEMVSQVWTDWVLVSPLVYPHLWIHSAQTQALLADARELYPGSPHVVVVQQVMASRQPPAPPQSPAPGSVSSRMPTHEIVPPPGSSGTPRTLNEITHRTPTRPLQSGSDPRVQQGAGARHETDVHQPNLLLPPSTRQQESPRATTRMQQFSQQNGGLGQAPGSNAFAPAPRSAPRESPGGQPPGGRQLPPALHQARPPMMQQAPRAPDRLVPLMRGGGLQGGGGRGGGIGSGGENHGGSRGR